MSGGVVIDLCDSSIDEGELTRPSTASSENTRLSRCQLLVGDCFWDSSDEDDPIRIPTRKDRQRRRKSKVVTPEDCHWKKALDNAYCSSVEDFSPDGKHQSKRKQPRILFSKHIVKNHDSKSRAKLENESNSSRKITAISFRPSTLDLSSSDDDSLLNDSVFSKKIHPTISSNSGARIFCALPKCSSGNKSEVMIKLHSAANDDKEGGAQKNKESNDHTTALSRQPSNVSLSSHVHLTFNPYAKQGLHNKLSSQSQSQSPHLIRQILQYPNVGPVSGRQHEDLRAKILLALWHHCRTLVSATFNLAKLDSYSRRIRELALATEFPIRSLEEFVGSGPSVDKGALQEAVRSGGIDKIQTPYNRDVRVHGYYSIAEAALVSILEHIESRASASGVDLGDEAQAVSFCRQNEQWIYLSDLIPKIDSRLNAETAPALLTRKLDEDNGEAFYTNPSTRSAEYKQLEQLTKTEVKSDMPLFKSHRKDKRLCYELTLRGLQKALFIRGRLFPEPPGYIRSSKLFSNSVEPCFQGICLVVDHREGGGACRKLHSICQGLDMRRVPYVVTKLDIGDYAFVCMKTQRLLPIIIERKSIQDVAQSIWDGRWVSQKLRMYQGQQVFGFECSRLAYLIEGHADGQELTGGAMGQLHFRVNRAQLEAEVRNLESEGFEVFSTNNMNGTLAKLVDLSKSIAHHYRIGKLNATFIYEEFMQRVKSIPRCVDFSKVAKDNRVSMLAKAVAVYKDNEDIMSGDEKLSTVPKSDCKARNDVRDSVYDSWKLQQLKEECEKYGLPKTGKKADLISRLLGPRPPTAWLERKKANLYVPARYDTCGAAILVALWLHQRQHNSDSWKGLEKEEIIALAESLQISKDPFTGTGKGLFDYDGWSCMGPLREGQSPLVWRQKGGFFKLTTVGGGTAGYRVAEAMHDWCHQNKKCLCMENGLV